MSLWTWFRDSQSPRKQPRTRAKTLARLHPTTVAGVSRSKLPDDLDGTAGLENAAGDLVTIRATYGDLVHLLGTPNGLHDLSRGAVTTSNWTLQHDGRTFEIYDYKATAAYDEDLPAVTEFRQAPYDWHVATDGSPEAARGAALVKKAVAQLRRSAASRR